MDEGRSRVANGHFLLLLICVLMLFLPVCFAYGDTYDGGDGGSHNFDGDGASTSTDNSGPWGEFWYGPNSFDSEGVKRWKTGVVAYTYWDAALYALGYSQSTINGITAAKKVKLMDSDTGGYFYSFAKGFKVGRPTEDFGNPIVGWNPSSMLTAWYAAKAMYGETYCYWQVYSDTLRSAARDSANAIIKGGSESGGSGSGGGGSGNSNGGSFNTRETWYSISGGSYDSSTHIATCVNIADPSKTIEVDVTDAMATIDANFGSLAGYSVAILATEGLTNQAQIAEYSRRVYFNDAGLYIFYNKEDYSANLKMINIIDKKTTQRYYSFLRSWSNGYHTGTVTVNNATTFSKATGTNTYVCVIRELNTDGSNPDPNPDPDPDPDPDPPIDWPTPPTVAPQPPDLPTPVEPITPISPDPTPPDPTVDPPTDPWVPWTPETDVGTGTDIQAILDAMNRHCIHLQNAIEYNVEQLYELQRTYLTDNFSAVRDAISDNFDALMDYLKDAFDWLGNDVIVASFTDLKDYLHDLFDWLSEILNVSVEPYDDTSLLYWLKQIWGKLGAGISIKPVDPSIDNDGWWEWFANLLGGLIGALADIGLDKIGGLVDALDTLKDKFPFCIPWDIAALLGLLVSEPVTPVVQVPLMALSVSDGVQEVGTMTIDLTAYDNVWDAVRWIERIAFCVYLATRTKDFLDLLGKVKG